MPPLYELSNRSERWVCSECASAVVSCEFRPVNSAAVLKRWNIVAPIETTDEVANEQREKESKESMFCTGFFMGEDVISYYILTCAHALGPAFSRDHPLTVEQAADLFQPYILCEHREQRYRDHEDEERVARRVEFAGITCHKDILLLRVSKFLLWNYCQHGHRLLRFAERFPAACKEVIMVSWPLHRYQTQAVGTVSHQGRIHSELAQQNPYNYAMLLSEINMNSESGSSGAPLVNGDVDVVGMLHGGHNGTSYFVSLGDIRTCLTEDFGKHMPTCNFALRFYCFNCECMFSIF